MRYGFEAGRTDFFKTVGIPNAKIEEKGILLPLYEMNCQFKSPAMYEDEILVITSLKRDINFKTLRYQGVEIFTSIVYIYNKYNMRIWKHVAYPIYRRYGLVYVQCLYC